MSTIRFLVIVLAVCALPLTSANAQEPQCQASTLKEAFQCLQQFIEPQAEPTASERVTKTCAGKSIVECMNKRIAALREAALEARGVKQAKGKMTPATSPDTASATSDTITPFLMSLGLGGVSESDGNVNLDFNTFSIGPIQVSGGATIREPEVFDALLNTIPEKQREAQEKALEKEAGDFDSTDFRIKLSWERPIMGEGELQPGEGRPIDRTFYVGRRPEHYKFLMQSSLAEASQVTEALDSEMDELDQWLFDKNKELEKAGSTNRLQDCSQFPGGTDQDKKGKCEDNAGNANQIRSVIPLDLISEVSAFVDDVAKAFVGAESGLRKRLAAQRYFSLVDLAANQPQVELQYTYRERDGATGPDEESYKLDFEWGWRSITKYLRWTRKVYKSEIEPREGEDRTEVDVAIKQCKDIYNDMMAGKRSLQAPGHQCLTAYLREKVGVDADSTDAEITKLIKKAPRFEGSIEYTETDDYAFSVPLEGDENLDFMADAIAKWVGSATFGKVLRLDSEGNDQARFDLEVKYEDVQGGPMSMAMMNMASMASEMSDMAMSEAMEMRSAKGRTVVTATYSQELLGPFTASFSAVWASKPDFLGDVDEKVSANFGLKWSFDRDE